MRRSKIETYIDILEVLDHSCPLKLTHVMHKTNVNCSVLKECLDFLNKQGLVEEKTIRKDRKAYLITQLGLRVRKQFRELKEVLPLVEETGNQERNHEAYMF
ncbi:MAG: winged helix-turn-helix domain-containing protein [Candidatus Bathyarchaeia archaeon]